MAYQPADIADHVRMNTAMVKLLKSIRGHIDTNPRPARSEQRKVQVWVTHESNDRSIRFMMPDTKEKIDECGNGDCNMLTPVTSYLYVCGKDYARSTLEWIPNTVNPPMMPKRVVALAGVSPMDESNTPCNNRCIRCYKTHIGGRSVECGSGKCCPEHAGAEAEWSKFIHTNMKNSCAACGTMLVSCKYCDRWLVMNTRVSACNGDGNHDQLARASMMPDGDGGDYILCDACSTHEYMKLYIVHCNVTADSSSIDVTIYPISWAKQMLMPPPSSNQAANPGRGAAPPPPSPPPPPPSPSPRPPPSPRSPRSPRRRRSRSPGRGRGRRRSRSRSRSPPRSPSPSPSRSPPRGRGRSAAQRDGQFISDSIMGKTFSGCEGFIPVSARGNGWCCLHAIVNGILGQKYNGKCQLGMIKAIGSDLPVDVDPELLEIRILHDITRYVNDEGNYHIMKTLMQEFVPEHLTEEEILLFNVNLSTHDGMLKEWNDRYELGDRPDRVAFRWLEDMHLRLIADIYKFMIVIAKPIHGAKVSYNVIIQRPVLKETDEEFHISGCVYIYAHGGRERGAEAGHYGYLKYNATVSVNELYTKLIFNRIEDSGYIASLKDDSNIKKTVRRAYCIYNILQDNHSNDKAVTKSGTFWKSVIAISLTKDFKSCVDQIAGLCTIKHSDEVVKDTIILYCIYYSNTTDMLGRDSLKRFMSIWNRIRERMLSYKMNYTDIVLYILAFILGSEKPIKVDYIDKIASLDVELMRGNFDIFDWRSFDVDVKKWTKPDPVDSTAQKVLTTMEMVSIKAVWSQFKEKIIKKRSALPEPGAADVQSPRGAPVRRNTRPRARAQLVDPVMDVLIKHTAEMRVSERRLRL